MINCFVEATKILVSILVFTLCGCTMAFAETATQGVVRVVTIDNNGNYSRGTGFVVEGWNTIVTAYHVVRRAQEIDIDRPKISNNASTKLPVKVLALNAEADVALLELPNSIKEVVRPFKAGSGLGQYTSHVSLLGFGEIVDIPQVYTGIHENRPLVPSENWKNPEGIGTRLFQVTGLGLMMLQAPLPFGVSGGPVLNERGEVVGIVSGALTRQANVVSLGWAIPLSEAQKLLVHAVSPHSPDTINWSSSGLIADRVMYARAFGLPRGSLLRQLQCQERVNRLNNAWDISVSTMWTYQSKIAFARAIVNQAPVRAKSRREATTMINEAMSGVFAEWRLLRDRAQTYNGTIGLAFATCVRERDEALNRIGSLPRTPNNIKAIEQFRDRGQRLGATAARLNEEANQIMNGTMQQVAAQITSFSASGQDSIEQQTQSANRALDMINQWAQLLSSPRIEYLNVKVRDVAETQAVWLEAVDQHPWDH